MILKYAGVAIAAATFAAAAPSLRTEIVVAPGPTAGVSTIQVVLEPTDFILGAYQGRLTYKPGTMSIISAAALSDGGPRLVNAADSVGGVVRFAGYTTTGFKGKVAVTLNVKSAKPIDGSSLRAFVDVAGDLEGKSIAKDRLIPANGARR